jgi:hypothetical protein
MLAFIATFLMTWLFISFIGYMCTTDMSYREVCISGGALMFMLIFGWIPSIVVCMDLDQKLSEVPPMVPKHSRL